MFRWKSSKYYRLVRAMLIDASATGIFFAFACVLLQPASSACVAFLKSSPPQGELEPGTVSLQAIVTTRPDLLSPTKGGNIGSVLI